MGKQYKSLKQKDIDFILNQKIFYISSSSDAEVNISPKGYDSLRIMDNKTLLYLDYPGSGNRTYRDCKNNGEFTLLFHSFGEVAGILRIFCTASVVEKSGSEFEKYLELFSEKKSLVRNFFIFDIYGVETSCGESIPYMEYKGERDSLKNWAVKLDDQGRLDEYIQNHLVPPSIK